VIVSAEQLGYMKGGFSLGLNEFVQFYKDGFLNLKIIL
jgi:hypothetical protein